MKQLWTPAELSASWSLTFDELSLLKMKSAHNCLGFSVQLKFFQNSGHFPRSSADIPEAALGYLADQLGVDPLALDLYAWSGRANQRHRKAILKHLGVRRAKQADKRLFVSWLRVQLCPLGLSTSAMMERASAWFWQQRLLCPSDREIERLLGVARRQFERGVLNTAALMLTLPTTSAMEGSLSAPKEAAGFNALKADPGRLSLATVLSTSERLAFIRSLDLPKALLSLTTPHVVERFRRRVVHESAWTMSQHPPSLRQGLYAIFLACRERELTDNLVDLLIQIVHKIDAHAERKATAEMIQDLGRIHGKERVLGRIATAAISEPDRTVREVVYPVADEALLTRLAKDYATREPTKRRRVHRILKASYGGHYRRMLPKILDVLEFRSNNASHRPVLEALAWLARLRDDKRRVIRLDEGVPIDGVIPGKWRDLVIETDKAGFQRINRINYEICVLTTLRERIRCKEVWIVGADRYRNPDEDLPQDFAERREAYYQDLGCTMDARAFTSALKRQMTDALMKLNTGMPSDPKVRLVSRGKHRISVSPYEAQPEPPHLAALKGELDRRWPMTSLLDMLKEADLRTAFTSAFQSAGDRVILDPDTLRRRLLLCLYGMGTNAGLKRIAAGAKDTSYKELLHVRHRFVHKEALRAATAKVANAVLTTRNPAIWGEGTTACASDSKKFGAWDQNLMTEWHIRYGGRGVMIYWHVERKSVCIYSQLKRCSSSEVASMIEGVLRHCTDMEIQQHYVDSHGQSQVAFAFCHLLGFDLLPRLKAIGRQRLSLPDAALRGELTHLQPILRETIDWKLIERQYDEMIKYAAALKHATAEPEAILRRFARTAVQHPTYRALIELGKAVKTLFLCRYLSSEKLRQEIHEGLNVVENWNSANAFIFFGKGGEVATNRLEDQELAVLALHLLQMCLVYVNTLLLQRVLNEQSWSRRMTTADYRAITPLVYLHVNPYGVFDLDMSQRLDIEMKAAA